MKYGITKSILIVEGDYRTQQRIHSLLKPFDIYLHIANDGVEAMSKYQSELPDLMITEVKLEKKDGIVLTNEILKEYPTAKIISISDGIDGDTSLIKPIMKSLGAIDFIKKPFSDEDLLKKALSAINYSEAKKTSPHLLLVEDDSDLQATLKLVLEKENFNISCANNGVIAIDLFKSLDIDLVITDLSMPEKNGLETIGELKQEDPNVKVIAISGLPIGAASMLNKPSTYGALKFIKKPFSSQQLIDAINEILT